MSEQPGQTLASRTYEDVLADAVRVLTEAARLTRPVYEPAAQDQAADLAYEASASTGGVDGVESGREVQDTRRYVETGRREPADFADFVARALAAMAANVGEVEAVLAGRPGSWEADALSELLLGTVGHDEEYLLERRTEPLVVRVFVEQILSDLGVWTQYDEAARARSRRAGEVDLDSPEQDRLAQQEEQLEQERERAWAAYGEALRVHVEAGAAALPGLRVPVQVVVDLVTFRGPGEGTEVRVGVAEQLLREAIEATPPPPSPGAPTTGV